MSIDEQEPHNLIADRLEGILAEAARYAATGRPPADFEGLSRRAYGADYGVFGENIDLSAIRSAASAVAHCMGRRKLATNRPHADAKIRSLRIAGNCRVEQKG